MESFSEIPAAENIPGKIEQRFDLVHECKLAYESLIDFRTRRKRSRNYYRGRPNETMIHPETGLSVYEDDFIEEQGRIPYKMNRVRPIVFNLKGQFRQSKTERMAYGRNRDDNIASDMMTEAARYVADINQLTELDADAFEENLLSGMYGWKIGYKWNDKLGREDISVDFIDPTRVFFNREIKDRRMLDIRMIGEIHDVTLDELIASFAKTSTQEKLIRSLYANIDGISDFQLAYDFGFSYKDSFDFFRSGNPNLCRIIEMWKKEFRWVTYVHDPVTGSYDQVDVTDEEIDMLNMTRMEEALIAGLEMPPPITTEKKFVGKWRVYFMTPYGDILYEGDTPYWHEQHPYSLGFASLLDGEIWGLVEDIIDPQRLINRLTTAIDYMFGASAKGVLMIPEDSIPEGTSLTEFAAEWSKFNGVIRYKAKPGAAIPQQVMSNSIPAGLFNWLSSIDEGMKDVSGVSGAVQGQDPLSGTPAQLYNQQIMQAQITNRDYFDAFFETRRQRDLKIVQTIAQFYNETKYIGVAGKRLDGSRVVKYNPQRVRDIEWEVVIADTADTPAARQLLEQDLKSLLDTNRITFRQYLQLSSHPKADLIEEVISKTNPILAQVQVNPAIQQTYQQLQMAAQNQDPDAMALMGQIQ